MPEWAGGIMIKPTYESRTSEQQDLIEKRKAKYADFFCRYPTPLRAWIERQDRKEVGWLYDTLKEPDLTPEKLLCLFEGHSFKIPSYRKMKGYWFRAAQELVDHEVLTYTDLAAFFGLPRSTWQGLVEKEAEWKARKKKPSPKAGPRHRKARLDFWTTERARIIGGLNFLLERKVR